MGEKKMDKSERQSRNQKVNKVSKLLVDFIIEKE